MIKDNDTDAGGTYLEVDADGSDGAGGAVAHVLRSVAETLDNAPENRRFDFELRIDERSVATDMDNTPDYSDKQESDESKMEPW